MNNHSLICRTVIVQYPVVPCLKLNKCFLFNIVNAIFIRDREVGRWYVNIDRPPVAIPGKQQRLVCIPMIERTCTSCQACVQVCPVLINPLHIINQLKRYLALEESNQPSEWNGMYSNIENNFAPWKFSPDERDKWAEELQG